MKIAIYYAGALSTMKVCVRHTLKAFKGCDVDLFLSIWDKPCLVYRHKPRTKCAWKGMEHFKITKDTITKEFPGINFKIVDIQPFKISKKIMEENKKYIDEKQVAANLQAIMSSRYYKIKRCNDLARKYMRNNEVEYDWVFYIRPDARITQIPDLNKYIKPTLLFNKYFMSTNPRHLKTNSYFSPKHTVFEGMWGTNDMKVLNKMCSAYDKLENLYKHKVNPDCTLGKHVDAEELGEYVDVFDFGVKIVRPGGYLQMPGYGWYDILEGKNL